MENEVFVLTLAVVVAAVYLLVLRLMDLNEKEPFWALVLALVVGGVAAGVAREVAGSSTLELEYLGGSVASEVAKFAGIVVVVWTLRYAMRALGWSEFHGPMDGVVYGMAVGLGFATGQAFLRELLVGDFAGLFSDVGRFETLWTTALAGLSEGVFGAIIGAGFGAAAISRSPGARVWGPLGGLAVAILGRWGYLELARGGALGSGGLARSWIALIIPVLFVAGVVVVALGRERRAIREQLEGEAATGAVTSEEAAALRSFTGRRAALWRRFMRGDFDGWLWHRNLFERQVELALAKHRAARAPTAEARALEEAQVERLRESIRQTRVSLEEASDG